MNDEKSSQNNESKNTNVQRTDIRERIALSSHSVDKLSSWVDQVRRKHRGVCINRKSLVNWLIETHSAELSATEEEALSRTFFDELKFLEQVMEDMKRAKATGKSVSLEDCMASSHAASRVAKRPSVVRKAQPKPDASTPST